MKIRMLLPTRFRWILASSNGDSNTESTSATALAGVFRFLEPHFPGTQWVAMSCRGGFDDVEPHKCPNLEESTIFLLSSHHIASSLGQLAVGNQSFYFFDRRFAPQIRIVMGVCLFNGANLLPLLPF